MRVREHELDDADGQRGNQGLVVAVSHLLLLVQLELVPFERLKLIEILRGIVGLINVLWIHELSLCSLS